jgi:hypothetical protein
MISQFVSEALCKDVKSANIWKDTLHRIVLSILSHGDLLDVFPSSKKAQIFGNRTKQIKSPTMVNAAHYFIRVETFIAGSSLGLKCGGPPARLVV